jgi:hypothetical protein
MIAKIATGFYSRGRALSVAPRSFVILQLRKTCKSQFSSEPKRSWYVVRERTNLNHQEKPWQNDSCEGLAGGENPKFLNLEQARFGALSLLTSRLGFQYLYSDL